MSVTSLRAKVKTEHVAQAEELVRRLFAAVADNAPEGIRYASTKSADGQTFVVLLQLDDGVIDNPIVEYPEFKELQAGLTEWMEQPPAMDQLTVIGSYRLF
ncbi:MAG: hypothetical protein J2P17_17275 [Mycobacterium sp.]|nr:hypothetical protein [Mycobacterium sp.]